MSFFASLLIASFLTIDFNFAWALERPTIPNPGVDLKLTQGLSAVEFFTRRSQKLNCRSQLLSTRAQFNKKRNALLYLKQNHAHSTALDAAEEAMFEARNDLLAVAKECGECATGELEKRTVYSPKREVWYITDGSCQSLEESSEKLNSHFDRAVERLLSIPSYSYKNGGNHSVLDFFGVDMSSGAPLNTQKMETTPFYSFIAVKGPKPFGLISTSFSYLFRNDIEQRTNGSLREFIIRFNSVKPPANFSAPEIKIVSAGGNETSTLHKELSLVQGLWYLNNRGYFRYYTAADFGIKVNFEDNYAKKSLLDTLLLNYERSSLEEE